MATRARPTQSDAPARAARQLWVTNVCVVALTIAATLWAILGQEPGPQRIAGTRGIALLLATLYAAAHAIMKLRAGVAAGGGVLGSLRISCIDLALYWVLVFLLAPLFL